MFMSPFTKAYKLRFISSFFLRRKRIFYSLKPSHEGKVTRSQLEELKNSLPEAIVDRIIKYFENKTTDNCGEYTYEDFAGAIQSLELIGP